MDEITIDDLIAQGQWDVQSSIEIVRNRTMPEASRLGHLRNLGRYNSPEVRAFLEEVKGGLPWFGPYSKVLRQTAASIMDQQTIMHEAKDPDTYENVL